ncbi:MAG: Cys-tRNA(Pro) deacylase [Lentisphaeria bacterium]|nr:Cys-tRNA(Pro) deacylase [Lentisphaeria bacterium]
MEKTNVLRLLDNAGVPYRALEYSADDGRIDALAIAEKTGIPPEQCFKTLVTENPAHEHFVFVMPATSGLDLKKAARISKSKSIAMILQKTLLPLTGYVHGGCSPVGMKKQFPTFIEETAQLYDEIGVSGGRIGLTVVINPIHLADFIGAQFADLEKSAE